MGQLAAVPSGSGRGVGRAFPAWRAPALRAGRGVCRAGDPGTSLYLVEAGLLHVVRPVDDALLARVRPGNFLGEAAPLTGEPRSATVLARVPSDVVGVAREAFLDVAERHPMLLANLAGPGESAVGRADIAPRPAGDRHETAAVILDAEPFRVSEVVAGYAGGHAGGGRGCRPDWFPAVGPAGARAAGRRRGATWNHAVAGPTGHGGPPCPARLCRPGGGVD